MRRLAVCPVHHKLARDDIAVNLKQVPTQPGLAPGSAVGLLSGFEYGLVADSLIELSEVVEADLGFGSAAELPSYLLICRQVLEDRITPPRVRNGPDLLLDLLYGIRR